MLCFASAILLNCRIAAPRSGWAQFDLMLVGAVMTNVTVLQGNSSVMFTSYPPLMASPWFYLGLILFAVGALIGCAVFFGTLVVAKDADDGPVGPPLSSNVRRPFSLVVNPLGILPSWVLLFSRIGSGWVHARNCQKDTPGFLVSKVISEFTGSA